MKAYRFIGETDDNYANGRAYMLLITQHSSGLIVIEQPSWNIYDSEEVFLENWMPVKLWEPKNE